MALEALKKISEIKNIEQTQTTEQEDFSPKTKWLVFFIGEKKYSVKENQVANILRDTKIFPFPFSPSFVDGVIDFHSKICSVINLEKLSNNSCQSDFDVLVVLKNSPDDFSIRVSRVEDIFTVPDEFYFENKTEDDFTQGHIILKDKKIPVLDISKINQAIVSSCKKEAL